MTPSALWTLVAVTWLEKLSRPVLVALCLLLCTTQTVFAVTTTRDLEDPTLILALLVGAGSIGRDLSSGVLALLFTRPLVRTSYVIAKWLAVGSMAAAFGIATLILQTLILAGKGMQISGGELWGAAFGSATSAFGIASVLVALSALLPGVADVGAWFALALVGFLTKAHVPLRLNEEWRSLLQPSLGWSSTFGATTISWYALTSYLSTVTLCLALGALAINRKEVSYASG